MTNKVGFVFSEDFYKYNFGKQHPLNPIRLDLTYKMVEAFNLLDNPNLEIIKPRLATEEELYLAHERPYVQFVKKYSSLPPEQFYVDNPRGMYGLGTMDDPVFEGMYEASALVAGASMNAAQMVMDDNGIDIAFNIGGGLHHASANKAHGFCIFNDIAIAIQKLRLKRPNLRIMYLDIDAHHGDGVQNIFYDDADVLTVSFHQDGNTLFPGTGFMEEIGKEKGAHYSINLPLYPRTYDDAYIGVFRTCVPKIMEAYQPDLFVTQLGVDAHFMDPLTLMGLSTTGFEKIYRDMKEYSEKYANGKWLAVGGGGYLMTVVPRAWTLALGIMLEEKIPNEIPEEWIKYCQSKITEEETPTEMRDRNFRAERQLIKNPMFPVRIDERISEIEDFIEKQVIPNIKKNTVE